MEAKIVRLKYATLARSEKSNALKVLSLSFLAFLVIMMPAIAVQASTPVTFGTPVKLGTGYNPNVQSAGSNVYVAWTDKTGGIFFRASTNDGQTWGSLVKIGTGRSVPHNVGVRRHDLCCVVWTSNHVYLEFGQWRSVDKGDKRSRERVLSLLSSLLTARLVSVVYLTGTGGGSNVTSSTNGGVTWTKPFQSSNGPEPQIAISGTNIYVSADAIDRSHIQFAVSHDSGMTLEDQLPRRRIGIMACRNWF